MKAKDYVGIWMDHRRAQMFWADREADITTREITSGFQEEGEPVDTIEPAGKFAHGGGVQHAKRDNRRTEQLKRYYKKLAKTLRGAEHIYLFGPGEAKKELAKKLEDDSQLADCVEGVEGADKKLTKNQKAAKVRDFFDLPRNAI